MKSSIHPWKRDEESFIYLTPTPKTNPKTTEKNWYITSYREAAHFLYWKRVFIGFQQTFRRFLRKKATIDCTLQSIILVVFSSLRTDGRMAITLHSDLGLTSNLRPRDCNLEIYICYFLIYLPNLKSSMSNMAFSQLLLLFSSLESPIMR